MLSADKTRPRRPRWANALTVAALVVLSTSAPAACSSELPGDPPPPEGCVDIHVSSEIMDDPSEWAESNLSFSLGRQPFWVDDAGVHVAWLNLTVEQQLHLVVSSFDRESGEVLCNRIYDALPSGTSSATMRASAGEPGGAFSAWLAYRDESDAYVHELALGHRESSTLTATWTPSWPGAQDALVAVFHLAWDGEAFAVHGLAPGEPPRLARLAPDGTVLAPEIVVGSVSDIREEWSAFMTDPETGRTWMGTIAEGGVWLSGHERDGAPLAGTEAEGGVLIEAQGFPETAFLSSWHAIAPYQHTAMLAWHDPGSVGGSTRFQRVDGSQPVGNAMEVTEWPAGTRKVMARWQGAWWMAMHQAGRGIDSYRLSDTALLSREPLVPLLRCSQDSCMGDPPSLKVRQFAVAQWQDELWFGFWDFTNDFGTRPGHPARSNPYRIVRVRDRCEYHTEYELENPIQRLP